MGLKDLFAQNLLLRRLSGQGPSSELALSMTGVRLGERVAQAGLGDASLLVAIASKVGYTGRACGVDADARTLARAQRAADRAGVLVELAEAPADALPLDPDSFDLVVVLASRSSVAPTTAVLADARRVLRAGGRCLVIAAAAGPPDPADIVARLGEAGFKASRQLALREGLAFLEAIKAP